MGELVKYNNDMNNVSFAGFKEKELDLFFSLCFRAKDQGTNTIKIDFSELRSLSSYQSRSLKRFVADLDSTYNKILGLNMKKYIDEWTYIRFNLFTDYKLNSKEQFIAIRVHEEFTHILNNLFKNYTKFDLMDFVSLKSSYSKSMFRLLKQWEGIDSKIKKKTFSINELVYLLSIPSSYNVSKINEKVLKPIKKELPTFFSNFNVKAEKKDNITVGYTFTWSAGRVDNEVINYVEDNTKEVKISSKTSRKIKEICSHNRFIKEVLDDEENLVKLAEKFENNQEALIKGLEYAKKEINKKINLDYLKKTVTTGAGIKRVKKVLKIVQDDVIDVTAEDIIKNDNIRQTSFNEIVPQPKAEEKERVLKEIYEDDFENLYKEYLKNNNADDRPYVRKCFAMPYKIIKREPKKEEKNLSPLEKIFTKDSKVDIVIKKGKKVIFDTSKIPEEMLLGKNGKKLVGGALQMRIKKILKEMNEE